MDSGGKYLIHLELPDCKKMATTVAGPLIALLVAPIIFHAVKVIEQDNETVKADLIASLITTLMCATLTLAINNYLNYHCHLTKQDQLMKSHHQQRSFFNKLFSVFSTDLSSSSSSSSSHSLAHGTDNHNSSSFYCFQSSNSGDQNGFKKRIDPKYFKPKFIIGELVTFWGTTCTVITWGSFYVIGGTIVATSRIAQKIKAKRTSSRENSFNNSYGSNNRGTGGLNDSFMSSFMASSSQEPEPELEPSQNQAFRKISSWTKRSFASMKRRFTRVMTVSVPQLTNLSVTSNLNSSWRSNRDSGL